MRMSCNGCRVLRKGCSDNCSIRPCLQWIKTPESQANATVFLAKFYGRAGLMNLITAGPEHLRPAIFRSLLYEACGRIVNPIYGSVGLLWSGSWQLCQAAVEAILNGTPIVQQPSEAATSSPVPLFKAYDIRHISKDHADTEAAGGASGSSAALHQVVKTTRTRFKRTNSRTRTTDVVEKEMCGLSWPSYCALPAPSHESLGSHNQKAAGVSGKEDPDSGEDESMFSVGTNEASHVSQGDPNNSDCHVEHGKLELELTLGHEPACHGNRVSRSPSMEAPALLCGSSGWAADTSLALQLSA